MTRQLIPFSAKNSDANLDVCLGSLSCMKRGGVSRYTSSINGFSVVFKMSMYIAASILPSKTQIPVGPLMLMAPHTCTFTGCFALELKKNTCISIYHRINLHVYYSASLPCTNVHRKSIKGRRMHTGSQLKGEECQNVFNTVPNNWRSTVQYTRIVHSRCT